MKKILISTLVLTVVMVFASCSKKESICRCKYSIWNGHHFNDETEVVAPAVYGVETCSDLSKLLDSQTDFDSWMDFVTCKPID